MNPLDIIIVLVLLFSISAGIRRGFIIGLYDMLLAIVALVFAIFAYASVAAILEPFVNLSEPALNLIGLIIACAIVALPGMFLLRPLLRRFRALTGIVPGLHPADRAMGALPGAIQGLVVIFVIVLIAGLFSTASTPGSWLADSRIGSQVYRSGASRVIDTATNAGFDPTEFLALTRQPQTGSHLLPFQVATDDLRVDPEAEAAMLTLVNQERVERGLQALDIDPELSVVARLHAIEMFNEGYFSHESPNTGSPFDRLDARGIAFRLAGENLAFARTTEQAHTGLMDSPGHRANILEPGYRRVGIGAIVSDSHGTMFVQVFAD